MSSTNPGSASAGKKSSRPVPERFLVSKGTLHFDRFMNSAIVFGGLAIVLAVFGIFIFILGEVIPLFGKAQIHEKTALPLAKPVGGTLGLDEWSEMPFYFDGADRIVFQSVAPGSQPTEKRIQLPEGATVRSHRFDAKAQRLVLGLSNGQVGLVEIDFKSVTGANGHRVVTPEVIEVGYTPVSEGVELTAVDYADGGDEKLMACIEGGGKKLLVLTLTQKRSLLGAGEVKVDKQADLTAKLEGQRPVRVLTPGTADSVVVQTDADEIFYFFLRDGEWELRQRFKPFEDTKAKLAGGDFLFGDVSLVLYSEEGDLRVFSLFVKPGAPMRTFGQTKSFPRLEGGIKHYLASQRNKSFVVANDRGFQLCFATTEDVRRRMEVPFTASLVAMDAKAEHLAFLDTEGKLHLYEVDDPHPEAGWRAFFGQIWYEGFAEPKYEWQSTSGTDDFEPKLSLTPLIIGSLKGTLYALIFAVPIALLAAIFVSQFMKPEAKRIIKPAMEIMASLPSVVLGFLAALWLAPLLETRVPSVLAIIGLIPLTAGLTGLVWSKLPVRYRNHLPKGTEYLVMAPLILLASWIGWELGPVIERWFFVADMPDGSRVADFRVWWPQFTGTPYDQRNCLVVGFIMGFAVIPIIFTISEDALSNVPPSITSASEALGASRWQVVRTVVLPIASAGIFSALMIGFGRAVGETMIVVMATGNTAIMDASGNLVFGEMGIGGGKFPVADHWNVFNGMRTLSANIAVELPEAAVHSTHYRSLFLGAMVLFLMTFALNTLAEVLRQRLREKFKIV